MGISGSAPTQVLDCGTCKIRFSVFREVRITVPPLANLGYICFVGADGVSHHLVTWEGETDEQEDEREVICGSCGSPVPAPGTGRPKNFACPSHDIQSA